MNLTTRMAAVEASNAATAVTLSEIAASQNRLLAAVEALAKASTVQTVTAPQAPAVEAPAVEAPAKAYRSAKGKAEAKAAVAALWTSTLAEAGAKKAKDLTEAQMDAYRAGSKAIWAAVPKTRSTKA